MLEIKITHFEGPLETLLGLIKKEKLKITEVSLVSVMDQYLLYVEEIKQAALGEVADFLLFAAKLLYLKSKVLLPKIEEENEDEEELIRQLKIYKEYAEASEKIKLILDNNLYLFSRKNIIKRENIFSSPENINTKLLNKTFLEFLQKNRKNIKEEKEEIIERRISIREKVGEMQKIIKLRKKFTLNHIFDSSVSKGDKVVSFLAILEIIKKQEIFVSQKELFSDIVIRRVY